MSALSTLTQRILYGGGPFVGSRAFVLGPAVVEPSDILAGHDTETFAPKEYGDYLATSSAVYAVVRLRYTLLSSVPFRLYTGTADNRTEVTSGEARDLFDRVNPFWTWERLIQMTEASLCLWGKNFWFIERSGRGRPQNIWWARPDRVKVVPDTRNYVSHFLYKPDNASPEIRFEPDETFWVRTPNPLDEFEGLSPIAAARLAADTASAAMHSNRNLFSNGIQAGGFVMPKGTAPWTPEQRKQIESGLNREHRGVKNAHRWGVFSQEIGVQSVTMSPKDAEFLGALQWTLEEVCRSFGVPLDLIGGQRTYANVEASERIVWTFTVRPEADFLAAEITEQLLPMFGVRGLTAAFDFSAVEVLKEAETDAWARAEAQIKAGAITINEWRADQGLDPLPWGDAWWAPLNLVPISEADQAAPPEPAVTVTELPTEEEVPALPEGEDAPAEPRRFARTIAYGSPEHQQHCRLFARRTDPWERRFGDATADLMRRQKASVLARLRQRAARDVAEVAANPFDRPHWIKLFREAARPILTGLTDEVGQAALDDLALGLSFDVQDPNVVRALEAQAQRYGRHVNETTWRQLAASLAEGVEIGEGIPQLADRIEATMAARIGMSREVIARTEVTTAANQGTLLSWKASGVVQGKTWLAALDSRTRPTHVEAHGQTVPIDWDFTVGQGSGPAPGQIGLADEDVKCRCSMTAVLDVEAMPRAATNGHRRLAGVAS